MITPDDNVDDNAKRNYERVKRWREKHNGLVNLKQREYRARKKGLVGIPVGGNPEIGEPLRTPAQTSAVSTLEHLRGLVKAEQEKSVVEPSGASGRPIVYRNDYGGVITKVAWEKLQRLKEKAQDGDYELDEYSQGLK